MTRPRLRALATASAAAVLLLAGCSSPEPTPTTTMPSPTQTIIGGSEPQPSPTTTKVEPAELDCNSLLTEASQAQLEEIGWNSKEEPFVIAGTEMPDGIQCMWADFSVGSGNLMLLAWSPVDDDLAETLQTKLVAQGMIREEGPDGVYVTEDPNFAPTVDGDGFGFTYLFGDGWVTAAETRASLAIIQRP